MKGRGPLHFKTLAWGLALAAGVAGAPLALRAVEPGPATANLEVTNALAHRILDELWAGKDLSLLPAHSAEPAAARTLPRGTEASVAPSSTEFGAASAQAAAAGEAQEKLWALVAALNGSSSGSAHATESHVAASVVQVTNAPAPAAAPRPRRLEEAELRDLLVEALKHQREDADATWELSFTRPWTPVTVPEGPVTVEILEPALDRITSTSIFRIQLRSGTNALGSWQVPARVRLLREVLVAHANLQRGQPLSEADLAREARDVLLLRQPVFELPNDTGAYELTEMVPAGTPLNPRMMRLKPVVVRGQLADATVRDGAMVISLKVEVLEEGVPGQVVRVRNPQSRRELRGRVEDEKTIAITL